MSDQLSKYPLLYSLESEDGIVPTACEIIVCMWAEYQSITVKLT